MRGKVLGFDNKTGEGMISGDDGRRYPLSRSDIQGGSSSLIPGGDVDFEVAGDRAVSIYPITSSVFGGTRSADATTLSLLLESCDSM